MLQRIHYGNGINENLEPESWEVSLAKLINAGGCSRYI